MRWSPSGFMASEKWSNPMACSVPMSWPSESARRLDVRTTSIYPLAKMSPDRALVTQTAGHASVAEVAHEAVARARLIPEDVRLVMAKEVTGYGVVPGFHRSAEERIGRDHDPARDTGGPRGDVAREVVGRNLHVPRA